MTRLPLVRRVLELSQSSVPTVAQPLAAYDATLAVSIIA